MSRSLKKGPYINVKLENKILAMNESGHKLGEFAPTRTFRGHAGNKKR